MRARGVNAAQPNEEHSLARPAPEPARCPVATRPGGSSPRKTDPQHGGKEGRARGARVSRCADPDAGLCFGPTEEGSQTIRATRKGSMRSIRRASAP